MYRPDYTPRDKPLRKWDQIGELLRRATQTHYQSERAALTMQIVALLNSEERRMIGVRDEDVQKWGDDTTSDYAALKYCEEQLRKTAAGIQAGYPHYFCDKQGRAMSYYDFIETVSKTRFSIDWNICRILRQVYEICESRGVRISHDVEAAGPRGHVIGIGRIVGERVEVETRQESSEQSESVETEKAEEQTEG